jgi:hypothetical protein
VARANREEHARLLAEKCRDDAAKVGINRWALEIVAGGDLISRMIQALNEAEFRQMCAISWRTGKAIRLRLPAAHNERPSAWLWQTSSSIVGAVLGLYIRISRRTLAYILAFARGALILAFAIGLAYAGAQVLHPSGLTSLAA